jgi:hypothetical protein
VSGTVERLQPQKKGRNRLGTGDTVEYLLEKEMDDHRFYCDPSHSNSHPLPENDEGL